MMKGVGGLQSFKMPVKPSITQYLLFCLNFWYDCVHVVSIHSMYHPFSHIPILHTIRKYLYFLLWPYFPLEVTRNNISMYLQNHQHRKQECPFMPVFILVGSEWDLNSPVFSSWSQYSEFAWFANFATIEFCFLPSFDTQKIFAFPSTRFQNGFAANFD